MADYQQAARQAAARYGLDPNLFVRQIRQESGFDPNAVSKAGAQGIAQIMPGTAQGWGVNPHDPIAALNSAAQHMAGYVKQYGSYRNALIAYNAGPGAIGKPLPGETVDYINTILGHGGGASPAPAPGNTPDAAGGPAGVSAAPTPSAAGPSSDFTGLLASLLQHNQGQQASSTPLAPPAFAAQAVTPHGFHPLDPQAQSGAPAQDTLSSTLSLLGSLQGPDTAQTSPQQATGAQTGSIAADVHAQRQAPIPTSAKGVANFGGTKVAGWIAPILEYARQQGWRGQINSGWRSDEEQKRIYDSGVRPAAKPQSEGGGGSNHEFTAYPGGAIDVTDAATLSRILMNSPYRDKLVWAGSKDPPHFSHPHNGSY